MAYIPNTEYITINKNGFFISDKQVIGEKNIKGLKETLFHGCSIEAMDGYNEDFDGWFSYVQSLVPAIEEIHVGAFNTQGKYGQIGYPSGVFGAKVWCRIKLKGKDATAKPWVLSLDSCSVRNAVLNGGIYCIKEFVKPEFVSMVLQAANMDVRKSQNANLNEKDAQIKDFKQRLQNLDLSKFAGKTVELNGYKIMIEKIARDINTNKR